LSEVYLIHVAFRELATLPSGSDWLLFEMDFVSFCYYDFRWQRQRSKTKPGRADC